MPRCAPGARQDRSWMCNLSEDTALQARKTCPGCKAVTARHGLLVKSQARLTRAVILVRVEPVCVYARP